MLGTLCQLPAARRVVVGTALTRHPSQSAKPFLAKDRISARAEAAGAVSACIRRFIGALFAAGSVSTHLFCTAPSNRAATAAISLREGARLGVPMARMSGAEEGRRVLVDILRGQKSPRPRRVAAERHAARTVESGKSCSISKSCSEVVLKSPYWRGPRSCSILNDTADWLSKSLRLRERYGIGLAHTGKRRVVMQRCSICHTIPPQQALPCWYSTRSSSACSVITPK